MAEGDKQTKVTDRAEIAAKVHNRTDLSCEEVGEILGQSPAWVLQAVNRDREARTWYDD
jgi:predicted transcriptional regulator